jgi:hypothetical protein
VAEEFEDKLLALERKVLTDSAGDFLLAVAELRDMLLMSKPGIAQKLIQLAIPQVEAAAKAGTRAGFALGGDWALGTLHSVEKPVEDKVKQAIKVAPASLLAPLTGLDKILSDAKKAAVLLVRNGGSIEAALAPIFGAATTVRSRVETQINAASNTASMTVGKVAKTPMVWEAERDACVHCLALAGHVVKRSGDPFPLVSFGVVPKGFAPVSAPPRHPHCRCRLAVLVDQSYADALMREAQRSVLRGFALPSESNAVRVNAASKLLEKDPVAPKSVKAYAAKAIREGKFPRGRDVPAGDPRLKIT